jgi:hypothetical protein
MDCYADPMLPEQRARSSSRDTARGTVTLDVTGGGGPAESVEGTVLVDAKGEVVGVDVEPSSNRRVVVMLGRHEDVATTRSAKVSVSRSPNGEVASVTVSS